MQKITSCKEITERILRQGGIRQQEKRLEIHPLGTTIFQFIFGWQTGNMTTPGIAINFFDVTRKSFIGGVMTQEQIDTLARFLDTYRSDV